MKEVLHRIQQVKSVFDELQHHEVRTFENLRFEDCLETAFNESATSLNLMVRRQRIEFLERKG